MAKFAQNQIPVRFRLSMLCRPMPPAPEKTKGAPIQGALLKLGADQFSDLLEDLLVTETHVFCPFRSR